jgi:hypothetical protein
MTSHLSPDEFVDALEQTLSSARGAHLDDCAFCRAEVAELRAALADASVVPAVEPSPLFWDHFSARVSQAIQAGEESNAEPARRWWQPIWKPVAASAVLTGAIVLAVALRPGPDTPIAPAGEALMADTGMLATEDDGSWEFVVGLSADLAFEDVREAVTPGAGTADEAIAELTAEQRAAFVRLLRQEIGEP